MSTIVEPISPSKALIMDTMMDENDQQEKKVNFFLYDHNICDGFVCISINFTKYLLLIIIHQYKYRITMFSKT